MVAHGKSQNDLNILGVPWPIFKISNPCCGSVYGGYVIEGALELLPREPTIMMVGTKVRF